jgi:Arc/MetJ family transcription regulator
MRTNVLIDDALMEEARKAGRHRTKRATIEAGLRLLIQMNGQRELQKLRGAVDWKGDLDERKCGEEDEQLHSHPVSPSSGCRR